MAEKSIIINGLCKSFGEIKAVNNLSFSVKEGELFAFFCNDAATNETYI